jgi:hypothetical protein
MKYLLLTLLILVSCQTTWNPPTSLEKPSPPPAIIARGTDGTIHWACQLQDLNPALAWVECRFTNNNVINSTTGTCIQVRFFSEESSKLIVESRALCSGSLGPGGSFINYAAFQKEKRVALRKCGELLDLCTMLAGPAEVQ